MRCPPRTPDFHPPSPPIHATDNHNNIIHNENYAHPIKREQTQVAGRGEMDRNSWRVVVAAGLPPPPIGSAGMQKDSRHVALRVRRIVCDGRDDDIAYVVVIRHDVAVSRSWARSGRHPAENHECDDECVRVMRRSKIDGG
jgi:hypothetical protein